ncbi:MAG: hypothetical protein IPO30_07735 [Hyphomonadaceae bacterium]|nr:hypothetical protein [Hyphomonadaceae bacterium]
MAQALVIVSRGLGSRAIAAEDDAARRKRLAWNVYNPAVANSQQPVRDPHHAHAMGDDDDGCAARLGRVDGADECGFALVIEMGIGLVKDQERRRAVECARQCDALRLAMREAAPAHAQHRIVALWQPRDQIVDASRLRSFHHELRPSPWIDFLEPRNVVGNRAGKERDILRQVSRVPPQPGVIPARDVGSVDADNAFSGGQHACRRAREAGLSRSRGSNHADRLTRRDGECNLVKKGPLAGRGCDGHRFEVEPAGWVRQLRTRRPACTAPKRNRESAHRLEPRHCGAPRMRKLFDRSKSARRHDRHGDQCAGRDLFLDCKHGACRQDGHLQADPHGAGEGGEQAARFGVRGSRDQPGALVAGGKSLSHAQGSNNVMPGPLMLLRAQHQRAAFGRLSPSLEERWDQRQRHPSQYQRSNEGMDQRSGADEQGCPRCIHKRQEMLARYSAAYSLQCPQRRRLIRRMAGRFVKLSRGRQTGKVSLEFARCMLHHPAAHPVQHADHHDCRQRRRRKRSQRSQSAGRQHAIVNLHHEQARRKVEQVQEARNDKRPEQCRPERAKRSGRPCQFQACIRGAHWPVARVEVIHTGSPFVHMMKSLGSICAIETPSSVTENAPP